MSNHIFKTLGVYKFKRFVPGLLLLSIFPVIHFSCNNEKTAKSAKESVKTADSLNLGRKYTADSLKSKSPSAVEADANQTNNSILSKINTKLDTASLFGIWTIDPNGPHADFVLSKKSYYIVDFDGDADFPYELKDNILKVHLKENTMEGEVVSLAKDCLKVVWRPGTDTTKYTRWKN